MSSRSGGPGNIKKGAGAGLGSNANNRDTKSQFQPVNSDTKTGDVDSSCSPLETRLLEIRDANGSTKLVPALVSFFLIIIS